MTQYDVAFQRPDYEAATVAWEKVDDVVAGQDAVKARRTGYLPMPMPKDTSDENLARYEQYLGRAVLFGATARTLQSLVGAAFRKVPALAAPDDLGYIEDDIDGSGLSIYQQSQEALREVLKLGRHALLVDYPQDQASNQAEMKAKGLRATVSSIRAEDIVNWRSEKVGAVHKLKLVVIREFAEEVTEDGFGFDQIEQYRVLRLESGYTQEVWRKNAGGWYLHMEPYEVMDGKGKPWDEIPLIFVGANNNDPSIDPSPLLSLAEKEIAHYQVSADCRHSAYMTGQAQPVFTGITTEWRDWMTEHPIYFGSSAPILLPENATAELLQTSGNTQAEREREYIDVMIKALGARLTEPGSAVKTATEAQGDLEENHSVLSLAVSNVSEAYGKCLEWMQRFMNTSGEAAYEINQEFTRQHLDAQMLAALAAWWDKGEWPKSDMRRTMRRYGLLDSEKTDEEIDSELENNPPGLTLDAE